MAQESASREQDKFMVRMPDGMRDEIAKAAKANNRSMNAEIVARLEYSFKNNQDQDKMANLSNSDLVKIINILSNELQSERYTDDR